ncbi:tol-pal system protein YbgF [Marinobacter subterrani]|uniref:Cell division coordinator CpoB n=1 Tax=Marinobacter subterrani TaxID=1658765 RepID=A0A0J7J871_9GAMM|nr:tol-pal system protein YbgF [Marinobacter subterrani]KMQ74678.1 tol-pal system protein YbgF [Marinobacter subterrani]
MRKTLMATVLLPFALGHAGAVLAQSAPDVQRSANNSQATAELFYMIQQLQGEVRRLQGDVEEQRHEINRLQEQARDRYIDLDQRILDLSEKLASRPAPEASAGPSPATAGAKPVVKDYRPPGPDERKAYDEIQNLIHKQKKYDEAISRIYEFLDKYPEGDLTVNAYYWLGEVYLVLPQLEQAKQAFTIVATRYADHRKAPDALYKLGVTLDRLGKKDEARRRMQEVIDKYPASSAADLARKYLESGKI